MEASLDYNRVKIIDVTTDAYVPNNDIAYLMYYLKCVFTVLKCNQFSELTNYNNFANLSDSDINELMRLIKLFNPEIMIGLKVFVLKEDLDFCNRFYKITNETMNIHANEEIVIGGIATKYSKIMLYRSRWLIDAYYSPLNRLTKRVNSVKNLRTVNSIITPSNPYAFSNTYNNDEVCCCTIF
jgi:hypothetical protein